MGLLYASTSEMLANTDTREDLAKMQILGWSSSAVFPKRPHAILHRPNFEQPAFNFLGWFTITWKVTENLGSRVKTGSFGGNLLRKVSLKGGGRAGFEGGEGVPDSRTLVKSTGNPTAKFLY